MRGSRAPQPTLCGHEVSASAPGRSRGWNWCCTPLASAGMCVCVCVCVRLCVVPCPSREENRPDPLPVLLQWCLAPNVPRAVSHVSFPRLRGGSGLGVLMCFAHRPPLGCCRGTAGVVGAPTPHGAGVCSATPVGRPRLAMSTRRHFDFSVSYLTYLCGTLFL